MESVSIFIRILLVIFINFQGLARTQEPFYRMKETNYHAEAIEKSKNLYGKKIRQCNPSVATGLAKDGFCISGRGQKAKIVVCVQISAEFLEFTKSFRGTDLSIPLPEY